MRTTTFASLVVLAASPLWAIPPESFGFPSAPNDTALVVSYTNNGNVTNVQEGILFGAGVPAITPTVAVNTAQYMSLANYNGSYVVLMVDPDASTPQNPTSRFILHWLQPNMMPSSSTGMPSNSTSMTSNSTSMNFPGRALINTTAPIVPYARPMPPPTSDAHRYIFYAFEQPSNFTIPAAFSGYSAMNRTRFNVTEFISAANLGTPAAANYFFCSNKTNVPQDFIALPGGAYAGGNGGAITDGPSGPATSTGGSVMSASASVSASATGTASARATGSMTSASGAPGVTGLTPATGAASALSVSGSLIAYLMTIVGAVAFYSL